MVLFAAVLLAAQITNVADAADEKHPFEIDLEATYIHSRAQTRITREQGASVVDELDHTRTLDAIDLRLAFGLWHDLELHVDAPLGLRDVQEWHYAPGISAANSTLANNRVDVSGCAGAGRCTALQPILAVPGRSERAGFFDPSIGLAWGPINEDREMRLDPDVFPEERPVATWVIGIDYTAPIGNNVDDPARWNGGSVNSTGPESRKAHVITAWTAFSKRYRVLEPYLKLSGSAPIASSKAYDNCSRPQFLADVAAANCAGPWKGQTGYRPPFEAALTAGSELVLADDRRADRRFAFDIRGDVTWHGAQRGYTQVTDALQKLTNADEYVTTAGSVGIYGRISRWLHLRVYGTLGVDTAHFLTHEDVGEDKDGDGQVTISQGSGAPAPDQNPNFDFRLDQVGRRLRAEPTMFWGVAGTLSLNF